MKLVDENTPVPTRKDAASYLFKYFLLANFLQYLEAGAVPALLFKLSDEFDMGHGQEGLLGGIVYIALSIGGPFAGYLLRHYDHRSVVGYAVVFNNIFTFLWAMTPIKYSFSKGLFISLRFIVGLAQCFLCVFLPLWINEYAPSNRRTTWMGYLQASVPLGVMGGYIIASIVIGLSHGSDTCLYLNCWRWPLIIEVLLLCPFCIAFNFVPREHLNVKIVSRTQSRNRRKIEDLTPKSTQDNLLLDNNLYSTTQTTTMTTTDSYVEKEKSLHGDYVNVNSTTQTPIFNERSPLYSHTYTKKSSKLQYNTYHSPSYQKDTTTSSYSSPHPAVTTVNSSPHHHYPPPLSPHSYTVNNPLIENHNSRNTTTTTTSLQYSPINTMNRHPSCREAGNDEELSRVMENDEDYSPRSNKERQNRRLLRQQAISASLYNVPSKDMMKKSSDDLDQLCSTDNLFSLLSDTYNNVDKSNHRSTSSNSHSHRHKRGHSLDSASSYHPHTQSRLPLTTQSSKLVPPNKLTSPPNGEINHDDLHLVKEMEYDDITTDNDNRDQISPYIGDTWTDTGIGIYPKQQQQQQQQQVSRQSFLSRRLSAESTLSKDTDSGIIEEFNINISSNTISSNNNNNNNNNNDKNRNKSSKSIAKKSSYRSSFPFFQSSTATASVISSKISEKYNDNDDDERKDDNDEKNDDDDTSDDENKSTSNLNILKNIMKFKTKVKKSKRHDTSQSSATNNMTSDAVSYNNSNQTHMINPSSTSLLSSSSSSSQPKYESLKEVAKRLSYLNNTTTNTTTNNSANFVPNSSGIFFPSKRIYKVERTRNSLKSSSESTGGESTVSTADLGLAVKSTPLHTHTQATLSKTDDPHNIYVSDECTVDTTINTHVEREHSNSEVDTIKEYSVHSTASKYISTSSIHSPIDKTMLLSLNNLDEENEIDLFNTSNITHHSNDLSQSYPDNNAGSQHDSSHIYDHKASQHYPQYIQSDKKSLFSNPNDSLSLQTQTYEQYNNKDKSYNYTNYVTIPNTQDTYNLIPPPPNKDASYIEITPLDDTDIISTTSTSSCDSDSVSDDDWEGFTPRKIDSTKSLLLGSKSNNSYYQNNTNNQTTSNSSSVNNYNKTQNQCYTNYHAIDQTPPSDITSPLTTSKAHSIYSNTHIKDDPNKTSPEIGHTSDLIPIQKTIFSNLYALFGIRVYRYLVAAMSALYFVVTGVQYWGTSYMLIVLGAPRPLVNTLFIFVAATAPTMGVFFGGWSVDSCGGYKGAKQRVVALELCVLYGFLACTFSLPITYLSNIYLVVILLWLVLFFGAAILPPCSGIILSIVPRKNRPLSSSTSLVIFNFFGYFLSLVLSGYLMQAFSRMESCQGPCPLRWGFRVVLLWSFWSFFFLFLSLLTSYHIQSNRIKMKKAAWLHSLEEGEDKH